MPQIVDISRVIPLADSSSKYAVGKMRSTLLRQGQIEPLQVRATGDNFTVFHNDPWGNEIVFAARELGWSTLLIQVMLTYEQ